jgi:mRNA interferase HicA
MKRVALIKRLEQHGCVLAREGDRHSVYRNTANSRTTTVPRHVKIGNLLARKICHDLGIPES